MTEPTVEEVQPEPESVEPALPGRKFALISGVAVAIVVLDQLTKTWALRALGNGPVDVVGPLRWNLVYNTGVAFSQGSGKGLGPVISVLALAVVVGVSLGVTSRFTVGAIAAGLISGGAIGNLGDRAFRGDDGFLHGAVIDFIAFGWWPVFNIADMGVVVGAVLLVVASLRSPAP